jgi:serine O-acetyltransferase
MAMIQNAIAPVDQLWRSVRREAETVRASDPLFGVSLSAAILDHSGLGNAVAYQIGERLGRRTDERERFARVARDAHHASPHLVEAASRDLQSIAVHDPAMRGLLPPLLNFKGYVALQAWRVSNWLWRHDHQDAALLFQNEASNVLQVSIHPAAQIGLSVYLDHATGIVIGANVVIRDEVTILQNVSIGRRGELPTRSPRIGRGVYIGAGATILGDISIGDFAKVGAGTVVTSDVPAGCTAVGNPARLTNCPEPASVA